MEKDKILSDAEIKKLKAVKEKQVKDKIVITK